LQTKIKSLILFFCFSLLFWMHAIPNSSVTITKTTKPPLLDGKLDDPVWQTATQFTNFKTFKPDFKKDPSQKTIFYMSYDEENLYFAFRSFDTEPQKIKGAVSKRDTLNGDDWVGICLDTYNDHQNAFCFILNPLGMQVDGMINMHGNLDASPDMVWYSKGVIDDKGYVVEFRVPLKSIRFPGKKTITMGLILFRTIIRT